MRILLSGKEHTEGDLSQVIHDHLAENPTFDVSLLSEHPDDLAAAAALAQSEASALIDQLHAKALVALCGQATVEERDTWPVKIAAAQAVQLGTASEAQMAMLSAEVGESQDDIVALANAILVKSELYQRVVGIAAKLRTAGKKTLEGVSIGDLPSALKEIDRKAALYIQGQLEKMITSDADTAVNQSAAAEKQVDANA